MTMGLVQTTGKLQRDSVSGAQTFTNAFPSNAGAGNTGIITIVLANPGVAGVSSVTVGGTSGVMDVRKADAVGNYAEIWRASGMSGGTRDVVVTLTATAGQYITCSAEEWDNIAASPLDASGTGGTASSSSPSASTGASTTETPVLLYAVFCDNGGTNWTSSTPPSGWTEAWEEPNGTLHEAGSGAYFVDTSATGTKTGTFTTGASMSWISAIAAFKLNGGASAARGLLTLGAG